MKVSSAAILVAMASAVNAFQAPLTPSTKLQTSTTTLFSTATETPPCATPDVIPESVTANALRSGILTDANGETIKLGDKMGKGTSIVVFLRHLG